MRKKITDLWYRFETLGAEAVLVASLLLFTTILAYFGVIRMQRLPDIAKFLPAEETEWFIVLCTPAYLKGASALPESSPLSPKNLATKISGSGFTAIMAVAQVDGEQLVFGQAPKSAPEKFQLLSTNDQETMDLLASVLSGETPALSSSKNYENARRRLPYFGDAFFYADLKKSQNSLAQTLAKIGIDQNQFLDPLLNVFPVFVANITFEEQAWYIETFITADKSVLDGGGIANLSGTYEQRFLPWTLDSYPYEWGSQNLSGQIDRIERLLNRSFSVGALLLESTLRSKAESIFGPGLVMEDEIYPLIDKEFWLGISPSWAFWLALDPGESTKAFALKDLFLRHYLYKDTHVAALQLEDGTELEEFQATVLPLSQVEKDYEGHKIFELRAGDEARLFICILEDAVAVATDEAAIHEMLDKKDGRIATRSLNEISGLLPGSEELFAIHLDRLDEGNSLKNLLNGFQVVYSTRKIFDDGMYSRHSLIFASPTP